MSQEQNEQQPVVTLQGQEVEDVKNAIYRAMKQMDDFQEKLKAEGKSPGSKAEIELCQRLEVIYNNKF